MAGTDILVVADRVSLQLWRAVYRVSIAGGEFDRQLLPERRMPVRSAFCDLPSSCQL